MFDLDRLFQSVFGTTGHGTLRVVRSGVDAHRDRVRLMDFRAGTFIGGTVGKYSWGWRVGLRLAGGVLAAPCSG